MNIKKITMIFIFSAFVCVVTPKQSQGIVPCKTNEEEARLIAQMMTLESVKDDDTPSLVMWEKPIRIKIADENREPISWESERYEQFNRKIGSPYADIKYTSNLHIRVPGKIRSQKVAIDAIDPSKQYYTFLNAEIVATDEKSNINITLYKQHESYLTKKENFDLLKIDNRKENCDDCLRVEYFESKEAMCFGAFYYTSDFKILKSELHWFDDISRPFFFRHPTKDRPFDARTCLNGPFGMEDVRWRTNMSEYYRPIYGLKEGMTRSQARNQILEKFIERKGVDWCTGELLG